MDSLQDFYQNINKAKPLIAIDFGMKKIGLALSDKYQKFATPLAVIENNSQAISLIIKFIEEYQITGIILGLPLNLDGSNTALLSHIEKLANLLREATKLPTYFQDERFTSKEANKTLASFNMRRKDRNKIDDKYSAALILESFIASVQNLTRGFD